MADHGHCLASLLSIPPVLTWVPQRSSKFGVLGTHQTRRLYLSDHNENADFVLVILRRYRKRKEKKLI